MRRPNGTGTIVRLPGSRRAPFAVRIPYRDKYGQIHQKYLSYHTSATDAQTALDQYAANQRAGRAPAASLLSLTVQDVYDRWSAREYTKLKPASISSHRAAWSKRISRYAACKMREVPLDDWQAILDEDEDSGLSQSTINNDAILIKVLYAYAMERDIVGKDYSKYLDIPTVDSKKEKGAFSDLQMRKLEQMADDGFPWADTALILCYTGHRISEFLSMTPFAYKDGCLCGGLKTKSGRDRVVPVHPKIAPYLSTWLARRGGTIITREDGSAVVSNWYREFAFQPIAEALGAPQATPHWCRHTFATRLHSAQVDELTVKLLLGHSVRSDVTAGYTHPPVEMLWAAVKKLA